MDTHNKKIWKFCHTLQDLIKCVDCDETLTETVFMCGSGHSICRHCHAKRIQCKKCHAPYTLMNNVLVQGLLAAFADIKACLEKSNVTKIEPEPVPRVVASDPVFPIVKLSPRHYRCWIATKCEFTGCLASVIQHLKSSAHANRFYKEHKVGKMPFEKYWDMFYAVGTNYNRAIQIPGIGLFILYIWENADFQLRACIFMYAHSVVASQYSYTVRIECGGGQFSFSSLVVSARIPKQDVHESDFKCLILNPNDPLCIAMREQFRFKCSIVIEQNTVVHSANNKQCNQLALTNTSSKKKANQNGRTDANKVALVQGTNNNKQIIFHIRNSQIHLDPDMLKMMGLDRKKIGSQLKLT